MRSFWIAVVLLILLLGGIVWNSLYINNVVSEMEARLDALPDLGETGCSEQTAEIVRAWEKEVGWVSLSVSFPVFDRVSEQVALLHAAAVCGDLYGYRAAISLLYDAVDDMRRLETWKAFV
ncbi:MAG TPA: hypothetical protein DDW30_06490 [Clostridiales bacterium]|nr:hypothetical protein [Clostridiales bacterium]